MMYHVDDLPDNAYYYRRMYKHSNQEGPIEVKRLLEYEILQYAEECPYPLAYEDCTKEHVSIDRADTNSDVSGRNCFLATYYFDVFKDDVSYVYAKEIASEPLNKQNLLNNKDEVLFDLDKLDTFFHTGSEEEHKSKNVVKVHVRKKIKEILYEYFLKEGMIEKCVSKDPALVKALKSDQLVYYKIIKPIKNSIVINLIKFFLQFNIIPDHHFKNEESLKNYYNIFGTSFINLEGASSRNSLFEKARRKRKPEDDTEAYGLFEDREFSKTFFSTFLNDFYFHKRVLFLDHRLTDKTLLIKS